MKPGFKPWAKKPKQPKAPWTRIKSPGFRSQQKQLRPEADAGRSSVGRSASEELRMVIYRTIAEMFKAQNEFCNACVSIRGCLLIQSRRTEDIHHKRGRSGLLLFDIRYFLPVCRPCHSWIGDNQQKAKELGLDESHIEALLS